MLFFIAFFLIQVCLSVSFTYLFIFYLTSFKIIYPLLGIEKLKIHILFELQDCYMTPD
jgi:hypothetical protein